MTNHNQSIVLPQSRAVFHSAGHDMAFLLAMDGTIIMTNPKVEELLGYTRDELLGMEVVRLHPEVYHPKVRKLVADMLAGKAFHCRYPLVARSGEVIPVETTVYETLWEDQPALIGISRNLGVVDEVFKTYLSSVDSFKPGLFIYNLQQRRFMAYNEAVLKVLGYTVEDIRTQSLTELGLIHIPAQMGQIREAIRNQRSVKDFELIVKGKDGIVFRLIINVDVFVIDDAPCMFVVISHIGQYGDAENIIQHQLLQQKLLSAVSQELNTPDFYHRLNHILGWIGEHTGVSRTYIFENSKDGLTTSNTFEWCNQGIAPEIDNLQEIPYEMLPSWRRLLLEEGRVFSTDIYTLPEDLISLLEAQNIKSILVFPLSNRTDFYGFIGFDECERNKVWEEDEVEMLHLLSNIISNAFERRAMMNTILENETRLKLAIGNAREGVWDWNIQDGNMYFDDQWCLSMGFEPDELEQTFDAHIGLVHEDDRAMVAFEMDSHLKGKSEYYDCTYRIFTRSGEIRWVQSKGKVIAYNAEGLPARAIGKFNDMTAVKLAEEKLHEAIARERELSELKSRFVSNASHEFRTPLATILMAGDALDEYWDRMDKDQISGRITKIKQQVMQLTHIVDNVLQISKAHQGKVKFHPRDFNLVELIGEVVSAMKEQVADPSVITWRSESGECMIKADEELIRQAINNLLSNAIKYADKDPEVLIELRCSADKVVIEVHDNGIGIPVSDQQYLFTPFFRASNASRFPGNGLGLSIVNETVKLHKGSIQMKSSGNQGTTFTITLPVKVADDRSSATMGVVS